MKITKNQLRRIIREEKSRLLNEMQPADTGMMGDKTASAIQMLQTAHANLEDLTYNVDERAAQEINKQLILIEDAIHAMGGVI
jgi:hypothetical protein